MGLASWSNIRSVPTTLGSAIRRWKAGLVRHTLVPAADAPSAHDGITRFARVRTGNGWVRLLAFPIHVTVVITIPLLLPWGYWEYQVEMSTQMHGSGITRSGQALREKERVGRQLCHNLVMWACHRIPSASAVNRVAGPFCPLTRLRWGLTEVLAMKDLREIRKVRTRGERAGVSAASRDTEGEHPPETTFSASCWSRSLYSRFRTTSPHLSHSPAPPYRLGLVRKPWGC